MARIWKNAILIEHFWNYLPKWVNKVDDVRCIMHKNLTWSQQLMDGYWKGLNGHQAAWAAKKCWSHCVVPASILAELEKVEFSTNLHISNTISLNCKFFVYLDLMHIVLICFVSWTSAALHISNSSLQAMGDGDVTFLSWLCKGYQNIWSIS